MFDEFPARLHLVAHEDGKNLVGCGGVLNLHAEHHAACRIHGRLPELVGVHFAEALVALNFVPGLELRHKAVAFLVAVGVKVLLVFRQTEKRRLRKVDVPFLDERLHEAEEKREKQRADMRAVDIGIGHDDNFSVAKLREIKIFADAAAERRHDGLELFVAVNLVEPRLFHVQHLAPERENRLVASVAAAFRGTAGGVAFDDVNFRFLRVAALAVRQFAGKRSFLKSGLAADHFAGFAGRFPSVGRGHRLVEDCARRRGVFLKIGGEFFPDHVVHEGADFRVAEARLRLALKLSFLDLYADDDGEPLAEIVAAQVFVAVFQNAEFSSVIIHHAGQRALESVLVRAAVRRVDIVGERKQQVVVAVVVLHCHFGGGGVVGRNGREVDDVRMDDLDGFFLVDILHEAFDAAGIHEIVFAAVFGVALVGEHNVNARIQKRLLAQPRLERFIVEIRCLPENFRIRLKAHGRPRAVGRAAFFETGHGRAALEPLKPDFSVLVDLDLEPLRKRIHNGGAHAVQASGNLVPAAAEFSARVQNGEHDGDGRNADLVVNAGRNAAAVVRYAYDVPGENLHVDFIAISGEGFVDGVVHDFIDEMMKSPRPR